MSFMRRAKGRIRRYEEKGCTVRRIPEWLTSRARMEKWDWVVRPRMLGPSGVCVDEAANHIETEHDMAVGWKREMGGLLGTSDT
jgi:hypothetical protein